MDCIVHGVAKSLKRVKKKKNASDYFVSVKAISLSFKFGILRDKDIITFGLSLGCMNSKFKLTLNSRA